MSTSTSVDALPVDRSIDELDAAICRLSRQMNSQTYRLLLLVREFDDRLGWSKWSFRCCAEWLAWRCGVSLSAAREKVRRVDESRANATEGVSHGVSCCRASADHYQVVVHVDAAALRGGAGRSDLPIETVRRLTCDGGLVTVLDDEGGSPLHVGRKHRTVSTPLRRAIWARDRGCSFPGCERMHYVDIHHVRHWADGGDTSLENLTLLCSHHHRLLHEGGFRIRRDHEGSIYFQRADGRVIPRRGYRLEDALDDDALGDADCPESWLSAIVGTRKPSAEVREPRGAYHVVRRGIEHSKSARAFALGIQSG